LKVADLPKREVDRFIRKFKQDSFYKYFQEKGTLEEAPKFMLTDMLLCAPDASKSVIKQKFERLSSKAELISDKKILKFLDACRKKFNDLLD
jgi:hypothetical protein